VLSIEQADRAIVSGLEAQSSGNALVADSVEALASGNAALSLILNNPPVNQEQLIGLIISFT
jgi:hypothetical protein